MGHTRDPHARNALKSLIPFLTFCFFFLFWARYFFQQLISGVSYCHAMSSLLHSRPKSTVGTLAYIAPEVLSRREYDGKMADVWSCGVTLYVMLVGAYPFEDQADPKNFRKTIQKIMAVQYKIPDYVHISQDCKHLLSRIFVANSLKLLRLLFLAEDKHCRNQETPMVHEELALQENNDILRKKIARYFFQQLISGVSYCHAMQICHRDLKLENTLLDGSPAPRLKICDFGYSKSSLLHSRPKSTVGTPAYIAPEVLSRREYDGKMADVWSCGVTLYVMLVGAYPFEDQEDPKNFRKTIQKIMAVQYKIPDYVHISQDCKHLLSRIFVANSLKRITIAEIKKHPWFTKNLPRELTETAQAAYFKKENPTFSAQTAEEIMKIVDDAKTPPPVSRSIGGFGWGGEGDSEGKEEEEVDEEEVEEEEDEEDEYDKTVKEVHASGEVRIS
ncbi:hypothetical protein DY000_02044956 [Brassica cretica]|uniref:non-specific serine/threonine protein kinase n=1 Tax=Brassica cretica TaxID=69181 RepID=A0ABQ7F1P4_BRACR|nr:hypothetical protein DY000_02044956 [Brassica cretica]